MLRLNTKWFNKWAKKNSISDDTLLKTLEAIVDNLNVVNLGGGLCKVRTPRIRQGKSGGYRTLVVYKEMDRAIFVYGFPNQNEIIWIKKNWDISKNWQKIYYG